MKWFLLATALVCIAISECEVKGNNEEKREKAIELPVIRLTQKKQEEVNALSAAVSTANDLYLTGYATYLEVITAQKGVLDAELQLTGIKKLDWLIG
jgi:hypothetical protein